jgi:hypothetical protein
MPDLPVLALDAPTLTGLVAVSGAVAVLVEGAKRAGRAVVHRAGVEVHPEAERLTLRGLGCILGVAAVCCWLGVGVVEASVGLLAGAASEVVYRWLLSRLPDVLARVER